jgi:hypothetical protein
MVPIIILFSVDSSPRLAGRVWQVTPAPPGSLHLPAARAWSGAGSCCQRILERLLGRRLPPLGARLDGLVISGESGLEGLTGTLEVIPAGHVYQCAELPALGGAPEGRAPPGAGAARTF